MRKLFLSGLVLFGSLSFACAQEKGDITDVTRATFLAPGLSYEKRIGRLQSLAAEGGLGVSASYSYSSSQGSEAAFDLNPYVSIGYRYYYNYEARTKKGKRTACNSLNYLTAMTSVSWWRDQRYEGLFADAGGQRSATIIAALWGMQRNYPKRFSLNFALGVGYYFLNTRAFYNETTSGFTPAGSFSLGFWLNRRKDPPAPRS